MCLKTRRDEGSESLGFDDEPLILLFFTCFINAPFISMLGQAEAITTYEMLPRCLINTADSANLLAV